MLMDYMENFARENNINYALYDSAIYAQQQRNFETTKEINSKNIEEIKQQNVNKNIKYC